MNSVRETPKEHCKAGESDNGSSFWSKWVLLGTFINGFEAEIMTTRDISKEHPSHYYSPNDA